MNKITDVQLDVLIKSAVNSSGPLPPDEKFAQIISALRELRELRAAMLQGAEPVTTAYKLPAEAVYGYFAFNDHHGEEFFKNREDAIAFCKEAIEEYRQENAEEGCDPDEVRRTCWGIIMQEGTDIEVDNEGHIDYPLTPELDGNYPVIPDGWAMVPVEPTAEMVKKMRYYVGGYDRNIKDGYKAMLAAAPQQEVKNG